MIATQDDLGYPIHIDDSSRRPIVILLADSERLLRSLDGDTKWQRVVVSLLRRLLRVRGHTCDRRSAKERG